METVAERINRYVIGTMGAVYVAVGILLLFAPSRITDMLILGDTVRYAFGGLLILYGAFRISRGRKKKTPPPPR